MLSEDQMKKLINLVDTAYLLTKTLQAEKLTTFETIAIKAWIKNYEVLQAEIIKETTNASVH